MAVALHAGDIAAICVYFVIIIGVGIWTTVKQSKGTSAGYFLAGRQMTWLPIGASVFASNIGAPMFIGLAGTAAAGGIAVTTFEWHAIYMILLLGWMFLPVYISSGCSTMPEFMKRRFGGKRLQLLFSLQTLLIYILVLISGQMYAGALFIKYLLGWDIYLSSFVLLVLTAIYTIAGGLSTVMWTDTVQAAIIIIGTTAITILSLVEVGGWEKLQDRFLISAAPDVIETHTRFGNWSCAYPRPDSLHLWRDAITGDLPWPGMVFGLTSIAMFVWCNDQLMVQRTLAAKNILHAKGGAVFASFLKIISFALFIIPGMVSRVLYPEFVACGSPETCFKQCGSKLGCSNYAYPLLVINILPPGATGALLAAIMSALMSSLTSILNSASSIFTLDLWSACRPSAKESEKMIVGRLFIVLLSGVAIAWLPILESAGEAQFWNYMQAITSYLAPPCSMCFLMAVLWTRMSEQGAFWGLLIGLLVGLVRMVLDFVFPSPICGSGQADIRPSIVTKVHYLHFAMLLSGMTLLAIVGISAMTKPRTTAQLRRMTWWTKDDEEEPELLHVERDLEKDEETQNQRQIRQQQKLGSIEEEASEDVAGYQSAEVIIHPDGKESLKSRCLFWLCGVHSDKMAASPTLSKEEIELAHKKLTSIAQDRVGTLLVNSAAVLCIALVTSLFGFFG